MMRLSGEVHMLLLDLSRKLSKRGSKYIHPLTIKGYKFTDLIAQIRVTQSLKSQKAYGQQTYSKINL